MESDIDKKQDWNLNKITKILLGLNILAFFGFLGVLIFNNNLDAFLQDPLLTSTDYLATHPWIDMGSFIWTEPSSSFFIFGFATFASILGIVFLIQNQKKPYIILWGIALLAWGLSAYFAGTSYQALTYELKCRNQMLCLWTSWCEIVYLCLTALSVSGMIYAQSYITKSKKVQWGMRYYALGTFAFYLIILIVGMLNTIQFLLTFEMMILFVMPGITFMFIQNIAGIIKAKRLIDKHSVWIWSVLAIVMIAYYSMYLSGIPEWLWTKGIWFNANDVLHIGLIAWMIVIFTKVKKIAVINET